VDPWWYLSVYGDEMLGGITRDETRGRERKREEMNVVVEVIYVQEREKERESGSF
jgi:hypothetical protein